VLQADALAPNKAEATQLIAATSRDLIVLDSHFTAGKRWSRSDVQSIRAGKSERVVLAYLSIGEAESYRAYWDGAWDADRNGQPDKGAPAFLHSQNPEWVGNYKVRYWRPHWQSLILAAIDGVAASGFDGLYLDLVDAFEFFEEHQGIYQDHRVNPETGNSFRQDMITWVARVAAHARRRGMPMIISQNGAQLLSTASYLRTIDGIAVEDVFLDTGRVRPGSETADVLRDLKPALDSDKLVFAVEYSDMYKLDRRLATTVRAKGVSLLFTDRELKGLGTAMLR